MSPPLNVVATTTGDTGVEFRVLIRGLKLDDPTKALLDAAIRSAVLHEVAAIDHGADQRIVEPSDDPQTRSIVGNPLKLLGLILTKDVAPRS